jgi:hypothetical protein
MTPRGCSAGKENTMRRMLWIALIGILLLPAPASSQAPDADLLQKLYIQSGMAALVEQIPAGVQAGFDQAYGEEQSPAFSASQYKMIRDRIPKVYAPEEMRARILSVVETRMTAADIQTVLDWLESPVGRKCTDLESAAAGPETLQAMQTYARELQQSPPSGQRMALLGELAAAVKAVENAVEVVMNTQLAVAAGVMAMLPAEQQKPFDVIRGQLEQLRPQIEAAMQNQTIIAFLYTYQELSEAEIGEYLKFARSDVGGRYHDAGAAGLQQALTAGSLKLGAEIGEIVEASKSQSEI